MFWFSLAFLACLVLASGFADDAYPSAFSSEFGVSEEVETTHPRIDVVQPIGFGAYWANQTVELHVSDFELGEETGGIIVIVDGSYAASSFRTTASFQLAEYIDMTSRTPTLLSLQFALAEGGGGGMLLTPGSVAFLTVWVHSPKCTSTFSDSDLSLEPVRNHDDEVVVENAANYSPAITEIKWTYPAPHGLDILSEKALNVFFGLKSSVNKVYLAVLVNPRPADIDEMENIFSSRALLNDHSGDGKQHSLSLDVFRSEMRRGYNSVFLWASGRRSKFDKFASVNFFVVSDGEIPVSLVFSSNFYRDVVNPRMFAKQLDKIDNKEKESKSIATKEERMKKKVLIVAEIPPRGLNATGDEHAVGLVVGTVRNLGYDFVIVSRICAWSDPTRGMDAEAEDMKNMDPYIKERLNCPVFQGDSSQWMASHQMKYAMAIIMSRVWDAPYVRGLPDIWIPLIRSSSPSTPIIVWGVDVHAACAVQEHYLRATPGTYVRQISQLTSLAWADAVVAYTREDLMFLDPILPSWVKKFHSSTSHGIEVTGKEIVRPFNERRGVLLFGAPHIINVESNLWFLTRVWPLVRDRLKAAGLDDQIVVRVVGMKENSGKRYAEQLGMDITLATMPDIEWLGYVADLDETFASARLCATPILSCPEFSSKNMRALERGVPIVTTHRGAQGYFVEDDESGRRGVAVCHADPVEFAAKTFELLTDESKWNEASRGALRLMADHFQQKNALSTFGNAIRTMME